MTTDTVTLPATPASEDESTRLLCEGYTEARVGEVLVYTRRQTLAGVAHDDTLPDEQITGSDVGEVLDIKSIAALARLGHTTATAVLALSDDELLGLPGIGEATLGKLRALAGVPDNTADG